MLRVLNHLNLPLFGMKYHFPRQQRDVVKPDDAGDSLPGHVVDDEVAVPVVLARRLGAETVAGAQHPPEILWCHCTLSMVYNGRLITAVWETLNFLKIF